MGDLVLGTGILLHTNKLCEENVPEKKSSLNGTYLYPYRIILYQVNYERNFKTFIITFSRNCTWDCSWKNDLY